MAVIIETLLSDPVLGLAVNRYHIKAAQIPENDRQQAHEFRSQVRQLILLLPVRVIIVITY